MAEPIVHTAGMAARAARIREVAALAGWALCRTHSGAAGAARGIPAAPNRPVEQGIRAAQGIGGAMGLDKRHLAVAAAPLARSLAARIAHTP